MDVKLPNLGEGADSGVVVSVLVKEGDQVEEGQTIIELENEKAVAPIRALTFNGCKRSRHNPGPRQQRRPGRRPFPRNQLTSPGGARFHGGRCHSSAKSSGNGWRRAGRRFRA